MSHRLAGATGTQRRSSPLVLAFLALSLTFLTALTSGCAYFNTFYHAKKYYGEAVKLRENEDRAYSQSNSGSSAAFKHAIEKCERLIQNYPTSKLQDDAYLLLAKSHYGRADYISAEQALKTFLAAFPNSELRPEAEFWQGKTFFAQEDYAQARTAWQALLQEFPKFKDREELEFYLAEAYWKDGDTAGAQEGFQTFLLHYPKGDHAAAVRLDLGQLLVEQKNFKEAEEVFGQVADHGKKESDRIEGRIRLGEVLDHEERFEDALKLFTTLETDLDPEVLKGRMNRDERQALEATQRAAAQAARADSLQRVALQQATTTLDQNPDDDALEGQRALEAATAAAARNPSQTLNPAGRVVDPFHRRDVNDPRQKQLAQVMIREGIVLAKMGRPEDALLVYEQVIREYPQTPFGAEAQYRAGYTYEVHLEQFDRAQAAYEAVPAQGASAFKVEATRRVKNLDTLRTLMRTANKDSLSVATTAAAEAKFMRAELYLFQQENPDRAIEEYRSIESEFKGTEHAAKAGLALAWITEHTLGDSAAALEKYAEVAANFPNTEYGRRASFVVNGPEPDPEPIEFAGPSVEELTAPENVAVMEAALLAAEAGKDSLAGVGTNAELASGTEPAPGTVPVAAGELAQNPVRGPTPGSEAGGSGPSSAAVVGATAAVGGAALSLGEMVDASRREGPDPLPGASGASGASGNPERGGTVAAAGAANPPQALPADPEIATNPSPSEVTQAQEIPGQVAAPETTASRASADMVPDATATTPLGTEAAGGIAALPDPSGEAVQGATGSSIPEPTAAAPGSQSTVQPPSKSPTVNPDAPLPDVAVGTTAADSTSLRTPPPPAIDPFAIDPLAIPPEGPMPEKPPAAGQDDGKVSGQAQKSGEGSQSVEKPSKSGENSGKNSPSASGKKPAEKSTKKSKNAQKEAPPDSTSGKGPP